MGLKKIFQQGMKELKRKGAMVKEKRELKQKEKTYHKELTALGQKAWESQMDTTAYGNLNELLTNNQKQIDELKTKVKELEEQKEEAEEKRDQEKENFDNQRSEVEAKKKEVDQRLEQEENAVKSAKNEMEDADKRINKIGSESEKLKKKQDDPELSNIEKQDIPGQLQALQKEKDELNQTVAGKKQEMQEHQEKAAPIKEESDTLQQEIDEIKTKQKEVTGQLDEQISGLEKEIDDNSDKMIEVEKEREENFKQLGEKLADAGVADAAVASEMAAVGDTKKDMAEIQADIDRLEGQGSADSANALWQMILIVAGGIIALVVIIILLAQLFGGSDKATDTPKDQEGTAQTQSADDSDGGDSSGGKTHDPPKTFADAAKQMQDVTGELKKQSEKMQGKEIIVSSKDAMMTALPDVSGWKLKNEPGYSEQGFAQLKTAQLDATFTGPDDKEIQVSITDTATASAMLGSWKMLFRLNLSKDNENVYEKITTHKGMPLSEKYDKRRKVSRLGFIVKDRYLIELKSRGENSLDLLKDFMDDMDTSKLQ